MTKIDELKEVIMDWYDLETLQNLLVTYFLPMINESQPHGPLSRYQSLPPAKFKKGQIADIYADILVNDNLMKTFIGRLPQEFRPVFFFLAWENVAYPIEALEKLFKGKFTLAGKDSYKASEVIKKQYRLLPVISEKRGYLKYTFLLYLPIALGRCFRGYCKAPADSVMIPLDKPEKTEYTLSAGEGVVNSAYAMAQLLNSTTVFEGPRQKIKKSLLKQLAKNLKIQEFFEDITIEKNDYWRTELMTRFLHSQRQLKNVNDPLEFLKCGFGQFFDRPKNYSFSLFDLVPHIKGQKVIDSPEFIPLCKALKGLMERLPPEKWVSIYNINQFVKYEASMPRLFNSYYYDNFYFELEEFYDDHYSEKEREYFTSSNYLEGAQQPLLKGFFFMAGSLGLLDLAYNLPSNILCAHEENLKPYLSPFDGLEFVRLTALGAYIMGISKSYSPEAAASEARITLDQDRLLLTVEGHDVVKETILERMAEKAGKGIYAFSHRTFLKNCRSKKDIEERIGHFKRFLSDNPPEIWKEFFAGIMNKIEPLNYQPDMLVFKLKQDAELLRLLTKDEIMKQYVKRAEDFTVVIHPNDFQSVRKRLEEFGYFMER